MKTAPPRCAVASVRSEVVDYVGHEDELIVPGSVIVRARVVGVIKAKFGTNGDDFVRPPGDTDGVLRIIGSEARPAPTLSFMYSLRTVKNASRGIRNMV